MTTGWSCAAARGSTFATTRAVPVRDGSRPVDRDGDIGFPGGVAFCPCLALISEALTSEALITPPPEGVRGRLPPPARSARRFFRTTIRLPGGDIRSGGLERSCAAARGTTIATTRAVPIATGINPTTATTTSVSGWCCVLPRSSAPSSGSALGRDGAPEHPCRWRSGNAGRSARTGLPAEAKEEEQRQTGLVRAHAARRGDTRGIARAGRIRKPGHGLASAPAVPAPLSLDRRLACCRRRVCLIQPPSSLPTPATMRLACSYWPLLSHSHWRARRRYSRSLFRCASAACRWRRRCAPLRALASNSAS